VQQTGITATMVAAMEESVIREIVLELETFFGDPSAYRSILLLFAAVVIAYWLSKYLAKSIIWVAQKIAIRADSSSNAVRQMKLRRVETYLSVTIAFVRAFAVAVVAFIAWRMISPAATTSTAAIGAGAMFIVLAGGTVGVMLRDLTSGTAMIAEGWFNIGDYIRIEPFLDVDGVVERATLRSTKLRSLSGDVIWVHNQYIQGVKVTPKGLRTIAVDIFVNDAERGRALVQKVIDAIPIGTLLITKKPVIKSIDQWGDELWRIIVYSYTAPGREWLMDKIFVESIKSADRKTRNRNVIVYPPIVRFADPEAERNFKRAIKLK
jgi:moderate conductance mechanosensitive channel